MNISYQFLFSKQFMSDMMIFLSHLSIYYYISSIISFLHHDIYYTVVLSFTAYQIHLYLLSFIQSTALFFLFFIQILIN